MRDEYENNGIVTFNEMKTQYLSDGEWLDNVVFSEMAEYYRSKIREKESNENKGFEIPKSITPFKFCD